jgi:hypothetical protein
MSSGYCMQLCNDSYRSCQQNVRWYQRGNRADRQRYNNEMRYCRNQYNSCCRGCSRYPSRQPGRVIER